MVLLLLRLTPAKVPTVRTDELPPYIPASHASTEHEESVYNAQQTLPALIYPTTYVELEHNILSAHTRSTHVVGTAGCATTHAAHHERHQRRTPT